MQEKHAPDHVSLPPFARAFLPQFDEIRAVLDRLSGFALFPVEVPSRDVALALAVHLGAAGRSVHVVTQGDQWRNLTAAIVANPPGSDGVVVVVEPGEIDASVRAALRLLNQRRDTVADRLGTSLLWCGSADFFRLTAERAPDFWSIREITQQIVVPAGFGGSLRFPAQTFGEESFGAGALSVQMGSPDAEALRDTLFLETVPEKLRGAARLMLMAGSARLDERTATRIVEIFRGGKEPLELARALELLAAKTWQNDVAAAEASLRESYHLFDELGDRAGKARTARVLGVARITDHPAEAEAWLQAALDISREIDDWTEEAWSAINLAFLRLQRGELGQARGLLDVALHRFGELRHNLGLASTHYFIAEILHRMADFGGALREVEEARRLFEVVEFPPGQASALSLLAHIEQEQGRASAALTSLQRAAGLLFQGNDIPRLEECLQQARGLPPEVAPARDAFIAATEARIAALRATAEIPADPASQPR